MKTIVTILGIIAVILILLLLWSAKMDDEVWQMIEDADDDEENWI